MQIIQFVFSVIIALCAVAMFVGAVITPSPIKVVSVTLLALICLFSLFLVKLAYCEMKSKKAKVVKGQNNLKVPSRHTLIIWQRWIVCLLQSIKNLHRI